MQVLIRHHWLDTQYPGCLVVSLPSWKSLVFFFPWDPLLSPLTRINVDGFGVNVVTFSCLPGEKKSLRQGLGSNIVWKDQGVKEEGSETGDNWKWAFKGVSPLWPLFQKVTRLLDKCLDSHIKHPCFRAGDVAQLVQCLSSMQKVLPSIPNPI